MTKNKKKNNVKRGPKPVKRREVILKLREHKQATSAQLNCSTSFLFTLIQAGLVERAGQQEKGGRGRKQILFKLSPAGNGVASSLIRQKKSEESISRADSAVAA